MELTCSEFIQNYLQWLGESLHCRIEDSRILLYYPYLRHDREGFEIEIVKEGDNILFSDLGELDGFMFTSGIDLSDLNSEQQNILDHTLAIYRIEKKETNGHVTFSKVVKSEYLYRGISDFLYGLNSISYLLFTLQPLRSPEFYRIVFGEILRIYPDTKPRHTMIVRDVRVTIDLERNNIYGRAVQTAGPAQLTCIYWDLIKKMEYNLESKH